MKCVALTMSQVGAPLALTLLILAHQVAQMVPTKILEPIDAMHAKVLASLAQVGPHARLVIQTLVLCSEISVTHLTVSGIDHAKIRSHSTIL